MKIPVLDHGFVRLVSYMQPVPNPVHVEGDPPVLEQPRGWSGDLEIVRNARVSHDADWRTGNNVEHQSICVSLLPPMSNGEQRPCNCRAVKRSDAKLILYMMENNHTTPFEAVTFTFEVKAPMFIFRQWHRHRTWTYNEVSARYTELPEEFYVPFPEHIGVQDEKNRQSRNVGVQDYIEQDRQRQLVDGMRQEGHFAFQKYHGRLGEGVPRELARANLPLSTYSRMFGTVNLHNLFHFITLRADLHAQWEMQQYARTLLELIRPVVPIAVAAYETVQAKKKKMEELYDRWVAESKKTTDAKLPTVG